MSNVSQQTTLNGWDDENVNRKSLILERTRAAKVDVVKLIPIFTQSIMLLLFKVNLMKYETAN